MVCWRWKQRRQTHRPCAQKMRCELSSFAGAPQRFRLARWDPIYEPHLCRGNRLDSLRRFGCGKVTTRIEFLTLWCSEARIERDRSQPRSRTNCARNCMSACRWCCARGLGGLARPGAGRSESIEGATGLLVRRRDDLLTQSARALATSRTQMAENFTGTLAAASTASWPKRKPASCTSNARSGRCRRAVDPERYHKRGRGGAAHRRDTDRAW